MKTIIETASSNADFSTLVSALKTAGLVDTLAGAGPFTVFAPTNAAFAKISEDALKEILEDKEKLTSILKYHVIAGNVTAKDIAIMKSAISLEGSKLRIDTEKGVMINDATVTTADIECSNGVIHAIDTVLMP